MTLTHDEQLLKIREDPETIEYFDSLAEKAAKACKIRKGEHAEQEWWLDGFRVGARFITDISIPLIELALAAEEVNTLLATAGEDPESPLRISIRDNEEFAENFSKTLNRFSIAVSGAQDTMKQIKSCQKISPQ